RAAPRRRRDRLRTRRAEVPPTRDDLLALGRARGSRPHRAGTGPRGGRATRTRMGADQRPPDAAASPASAAAPRPAREVRRVSDQVWTGQLNDEVRIGGHVGLYDTTLRDGEQTVGVVLDPEEKLEIARLLDELGVDRIEGGFPRVSAEDRRAVELIQSAGLR